MKKVKKNKNSLKYKKNISIVFIIFLFMFLSLISYFYFFTFPTPLLLSKNISIDNNNLKVKIKYDINKYNKDFFYIFKTDGIIPKYNDKDWKIAKNNECITEMKKEMKYTLYIKNENNEIFEFKETSKLGKILDLKINKDKVYLAIDGNYELKSEIESIGNIDTKINWSSENNDIASVDENGIIKGISKGETKIHAKLSEFDKVIDVIVTDLIITRPDKYNSKKSYLPCGIYSKEDNDLLDEILADRIKDAGYKTRAGVVEAARFLALEFPYKIRYFSENGRGSTNGVDGEGRYYHVGLYLDESRFDNIGKKSAGPQTWGCQLYSRPSKGKRANGFDCSGFVSWVLLNGGFDVGDIGAGLAPHLDLTDYGKRINFNANVVKSGQVKVGDLLSSGGVQGGHIALIVGEDDKYYYVAESLWTPPNVAVVIIGYDKKTIFNRYYYVMLMDEYYKEDGNLTQLWY